MFGLRVNPFRLTVTRRQRKRDAEIQRQIIERTVELSNASRPQP